MSVPEGGTNSLVSTITETGVCLGDASLNTTKKDGLLRLIEKQAEEVDAVTKKIEIYTKYKDDYRDLKKLIDRMQDKVSYPHKVPIAGSNLAFIDGRLIHTNEFHVLLGDNYFALRSARQATQIVSRRLKDIDGNLKANEDAKRQAEQWLNMVEEHKRDKEEFVEIIETS